MDVRSTGEPTVLSSVLGAISAYAMGLGLSAREVREAAGAPLVELMQPDARSSYRDGLRLWNLLAERFPDRALGLGFSRQVPLSAFGVVTYAARNAPDVRAAMDIWLRYSQITSSHLEIHIDDVGVVLSHHPMLQTQPHLMDCMMVLSCRQIGAFTGADNLVERVLLKHAAQAPRAVYEDALNTEVEFHQPKYAMILDPDAYDRPILAADANLLRFLKAHLDQAHAEVRTLSRGPGERFMIAVNEAIRQLADENVYSVSALADALGVTSRTLQRRISATGESVKELIDRHRRARASRLLSRSMLSTDDIAFLVGYSDARAFRRAFKRWTGHTPAEFRQGAR